MIFQCVASESELCTYRIGNPKTKEPVTIESKLTTLDTILFRLGLVLL